MSHHPSRMELREYLARVIYNLDDSIIEDLRVAKMTKAGFHGFNGFSCPCCGEISHKERSFNEAIAILKENRMFICGFCLNTGNKLTSDSSISGVILQAKHSVLRIMGKMSAHLKKTGNYTDKQQWRKELRQDWFKFLTLKEEGEKQTIELTLVLDTGTYTMSLSQWNKKIESVFRMKAGNFNEQGHIKDEEKHIERLRKVHPNGLIHQLNSAREISEFSCGEVTVVGDNLFEHEYFTISTNKMNERIKRNGDKTSFCMMCCEEDDSLIPPKTEKTIEMVNKLWLIRSLKVASILDASDVSIASVELAEGDKIGTNSKLRFKCFNPNHKPSEGTYSNKMSKGRGGYCKLCLKEAGLKTISEI